MSKTDQAPVASFTRSDIGEQAALALALVYLIQEAGGQHPRLADVFEAVSRLARARVVDYRFRPGASWSAELWADLDAARSEGLICYYKPTRGSLLPRRRVALTENGRQLARQAMASTQYAVLFELRQTARAAVLRDTPRRFASVVYRNH